MRALLEALQAGIVDASPLPRRFLKPKTQLTPAKQVNIYAHAYKGRLRDILESDYPLLLKQLGKRKFKMLAETYIAEQPPRQVDLGAYSRSFAGFLKHKHNVIPEKALKTASLEAAELQVLELESQAPFRPDANSSMEQLLALCLKAQPASIWVDGQFIYRIGGEIHQHPMTEEMHKSIQDLSKGTLAQWLERQPMTQATTTPGWLMQWLAQALLCKA